MNAPNILFKECLPDYSLVSNVILHGRTVIWPVFRQALSVLTGICFDNVFALNKTNKIMSAGLCLICSNFINVNHYLSN